MIFKTFEFSYSFIIIIVDAYNYYNYVCSVHVSILSILQYCTVYVHMSID